MGASRFKGMFPNYRGRGMTICLEFYERSLFVEDKCLNNEEFLHWKILTYLAKVVKRRLGVARRSRAPLAMVKEELIRDMEWVDFC